MSTSSTAIALISSGAVSYHAPERYAICQKQIKEPHDMTIISSCYVIKSAEVETVRVKTKDVNVADLTAAAKIKKYVLANALSSVVAPSIKTVSVIEKGKADLNPLGLIFSSAKTVVELEEFKSTVNENMAVVSEHSLTKRDFNKTSVFVLGNTKQDIRLNVKESFCHNNVPSPLKNVLTVPPKTVTVSDYKPPSIGSAANGEGVRFIRFTAQKNAFCEIYLDFTNRRVVEVVGLPDGMILEQGVLKGSPTVSGRYPLTLKLDNASILEALLTVPELPRLL